MVVQAGMFIDESLGEMEEVGRRLPRAEFRCAVGALYECWHTGGIVFAAGYGGSASTATRPACDLATATIVPERRRLRTASLGDNIPLSSARANDSGFAGVFAQQLAPRLTDGDLPVAPSADVRTVAPIGSEPFGTPIVESWRAAIRHLLRLALRGRNEEEGE